MREASHIRIIYGSVRAWDRGPRISLPAVVIWLSIRAQLYVVDECRKLCSDVILERCCTCRRPPKREASFQPRRVAEMHFCIEFYRWQDFEGKRILVCDRCPHMCQDASKHPRTIIYTEGSDNVVYLTDIGCAFRVPWHAVIFHACFLYVVLTMCRGSALQTS